MHPRVRFAGALAFVTLAYVLAGMLGLAFARVNASTSAIWPASGIAVAALLVLGLRMWPALLLGAFLTNLTVAQAVVPAAAIAAGNTLEYVLAALLTNRFARGVQAFNRGSRILRFTAGGALAAPLVAATVGTFALRLSGLAPAGDGFLIWLTWWLGDATGIVLVTPVCVLWSLRQPPARAGRAESVALCAGLAAVVSASFVASPAILQNAPLAVLMLPIFLWAAFRFGPRATASIGIAFSGVAVYRTIAGLGPFTLGDQTVSLLIVQCVVAIISVLMLSVAAEATLRREMETEARRLTNVLERRVEERTAELSRVHDRLVEAQAVAHVGSWEWNVPTDSLWWSEELCRIYGVDRAPADYGSYLALVHPDDRQRVEDHVRRGIERRESFSLEHRIVRDGDVRTIYARGHVEADATGNPARLMGIGHDITDRVRAEAQRGQMIHDQARLREAEEANRAKDAFLATLSHELRTPLNAAMGWAHILRDSLHTAGRDARAVEAIYRNLLVQSRLVSDILDISQITKGELPLERDAVQMSAVFESALEMVRDDAASRGVTIACTFADTAPVTGDARRLQQVAWNLLANAVKFAADGGHVTVTVRERDDTVECSVEDDGPGIAPDFLPHVFERFRQADSSPTRQYGGLGLGLAIARDIVMLHGGTIDAQNRPEGGAAFIIRLPARRAGVERARKTAAEGDAAVTSEPGVGTDA
jgi:PAS domain S-box-containing protein